PSEDHQQPGADEERRAGREKPEKRAHCQPPLPVGSRPPMSSRNGGGPPGLTAGEAAPPPTPRGLPRTQPQKPARELPVTPQTTAPEISPKMPTSPRKPATIRHCGMASSHHLPRTSPRERRSGYSTFSFATEPGSSSRVNGGYRSVAKAPIQ